MDGMYGWCVLDGITMDGMYWMASLWMVCIGWRHYGWCVLDGITMDGMYWMASLWMVCIGWHHYGWYVLDLQHVV